MFSGPETDLSMVVAYPDLIYNSRYQLAAAASARYRYAISDVRNKHDITVMRGMVFLDGHRCARFLRIEYRASRLYGFVRAGRRQLGDKVLAWIRLDSKTEATIHLHYCPLLGSYEVELWDTLEPPLGSAHDHAVLCLLGRDARITRPAALAEALASTPRLCHIELAFREAERTSPDGWPITEPVWDNNFDAHVHVPISETPSDPNNLVHDPNYFIEFARGFFRPAGSVPPVLFRNWQIDKDDAEAADNNVLGRRYFAQREFAGRMVHCYETSLSPGGVEGCHRHVGAEELIYVVRGEGQAFVASGDLPDAELYATVVRPVYGIGDRPCRELPLGPGAVVYTKGGGIHGLRNTGKEPLVYVGFLFQTD